MDALKTVLVANRGEIAVRLINSAKLQGVRTVAIYTQSDSASQHVLLADESVLLQGLPSTAYLDGDQILDIALQRGAQAVIPGYGFLSENPDFARQLEANGIVFVGPSPETIESFGLKHTAREHAVRAGVPIVPGSDGLVRDADQAVEVAERLGFPIMLKATAGGGGMGLLICHSKEEVFESFSIVQSRGSRLFKNGEVFMERYFPSSHHIEVQVFGNGLGAALSIGERECSIQRRHQKVIEECPSPLIENQFPHLRKLLTDAAVSLARSVNYASAGTVEFLVDDETGSFFFLEMNTRLQVEHGITEMCYNIDLVELMYRQADAQLQGKGGLTDAMIEQLQSKCLIPQGHAIELRLCAENPAQDYAPSPGVLQKVDWHRLPRTRIDTWIRTGLSVTTHYDSLLAKIMHHAPSREQARQEIIKVATNTVVAGPPNNLDFLLSILAAPEFEQGQTLTRFLSSFDYVPSAIEVLSGGVQTLVQDYPGRPTIGRGFGHAGPMDPLAFRIANALVGNSSESEGLEILLEGPSLKFTCIAVVALCGPLTEATVDGIPFPMWSCEMILPGQTLRIGKVEQGCRAYLSVLGGFTNVAEWFGSKSTCPGVGIGGYQGRGLRTGDLLFLDRRADHTCCRKSTIPEACRPSYTECWDIRAMGGPFEEGYLLPEDVDQMYSATWKVSHNAARGGIRLIGPHPRWARPDGAEGGSHPSNVIEYGYPLGGLNWTGNDPVVFPMDCPDFGGFLCSLKVISGDLWKVGQLKPGDTLRFHRVSLEDALSARKLNDTYLATITSSLASGHFTDFESPSGRLVDTPTRCLRPAAVLSLPETKGRPRTSYRQGGDNFLLVEYGNGGFDLNLKCRATSLARRLWAAESGITFNSGLLNTVGCGSSLQIYYDGLKISQRELISYLRHLEAEFDDASAVKLRNRTFSLPIVFDHPKLRAATERYMENQRPHAPYLPDNFDFVARNNGITHEQLKKIFLEAQFIVVGVGFVTALPQCLPADPRHRLSSPKANPSRTFTPEGTVSWGGSCMALYNTDGPGGYMMTGMSIPGVDKLGYKAGYTPERPWLFEDMDVITFYEVTHSVYDAIMETWRSGRYQYDRKDSVFDLAEHNQLLHDTKDEVAAMKAKQILS